MTRAARIIEFIERYCVTPEGASVGQPLVLAEFQKDFIRQVYDNPAGTRRAILSVSRKNGKSGCIAALLLAHLVGPEAKQNSQLVSGAMSRDQAALVFKLASDMVRLSPELSELVRIIPSGKRLIGLPLNTEYKALDGPRFEPIACHPRRNGPGAWPAKRLHRRHHNQPRGPCGTAADRHQHAGGIGR